MISCGRARCTEQVADEKWAKIRAASSGWFFLRDGRAWCPRHVPRWVEDWRRGQQLAQARAAQDEIPPVCHC